MRHRTWIGRTLVVYTGVAELSLAKMVNRAFRSTIEGSIRLRRAMFVTYVPRLSPASAPYGLPMANPLLLFDLYPRYGALMTCGFAFKEGGWEKRNGVLVNPPVFHMYFHRHLVHSADYLDELEELEKKGCWQFTKVTNFPVAVRVRFSTTYGFNTSAVCMQSTLEKEATLGEIWNLSLQIRRRSIALHWETYPSLRYRHYRD